ncbi:ABC transporter ATP-binding protein [Bradyrhizobium sp. CCGUVB23]|uniref:ABC transporter ATP-binding protein n=1 Tax=Bradyrhizobium sp. CCGUVB23 TaxID=2949630 RepID=UPI0020B288CB|nr:ABC transporter ATP-binding protein [Bradyrhizobium sp. CCGUVB23]MCP3464539.1 ABC transporter ATP-binding protein [Bradyrhizobium sp. CCGUVB23]
MARISVENISKAFRQADVLNDVSLDIAHGEFLTLVGPSGCGKTTLLRIIAGFEDQDSGSIRIADRCVDALRPKQRDLAMVFQSYALYPHMTVAKNVALPLTMRRMNVLQRLPLIGRIMPGAGEARRAIAADVCAVTSALGIDHLHDRRPSQLSGGQRQRVALARAMVRQPLAFLMDEPLSNLDAKMRLQARAEIAELHHRLGATFIYVTHDQAEAMTMSDRVAVMMGGRLLQVAPPQQVYDDPATIEIARFIGTPEINVIPATVRADGCVEVLGRSWPISARVDAGAPVSLAIRPEAWTLEDENARGAELTGTVRHFEPLGSETLVYVGVENLASAVVMRADPVDAARLAVGRRVRIWADPSRVLLFDATGRRVRATASNAVPRLAEVRHG